LLGPVRHRSAQAQIHLTVIHARATLVSARTAGECGTRIDEIVWGATTEMWLRANESDSETISLLRTYIANVRIRFTLALLFLWVLLACDLSRASDLVLVGAKIYPSPTEPPIENGAILIHDAHILAIDLLERQHPDVANSQTGAPHLS
jgi:hypothetical protein